MFYFDIPIVKNIEQEMNKLVIHVYIPMLFSDLITPCSLYRIQIGNDDVMVNSALVITARFR